MKRYDIYNPYQNQEVTKFYVSIIEKAIVMSGKKSKYIEKIKRNKQMDCGIVVISLWDVFKARICGYKECILWIQGACPEESFMRHTSKVRMFLLNIIEYWALKCSSKILLVSEEMKKHLEKKYHCRLSNVFIMPCFNELLKEENFKGKDKYVINDFLYVGGLSPWQRFEDIVRTYKIIEENVSNVRLIVYSRQKQEALDIIQKYGIKRYKVGYVEADQLSEEIKDVKFGFVIREDTIVNRVATPTKLSNYLSNGIIPIYSECLRDFHKYMGNQEYLICLQHLCNRQEIMEKIVHSVLLEKIDYNNVLKEYKKIFSEYYSEDFYVAKLTGWLGE